MPICGGGLFDRSEPLQTVSASNVAAVLLDAGFGRRVVEKSEVTIIESPPRSFRAAFFRRTLRILLRTAESESEFAADQIDGIELLPAEEFDLALRLAAVLPDLLDTRVGTVAEMAV